MTRPREELNRLAFDWDSTSRNDSRDHHNFSSIIEDILFHGDLRFEDYQAFAEDGPFVRKLANWIGNGRTEQERKTLCLLAKFILFVDSVHLKVLYRDAYRRIIVPWLLTGNLSLDDQLAPDYEARVLSVLRKRLLLSVTESFSFSDFLSINSLPNLPRPTMLGEKPAKVFHRLPSDFDRFDGALITEDFVGSGLQSGKVLLELLNHLPTTWPVAFVPLIILESGHQHLRRTFAESRIDIKPVLVVRDRFCLKEEAVPGEAEEFKRIRTFIRSSANRVLQRLDRQDVVPRNPFGFRSSGAILVTAHNTPNNTLPLLHHKAPLWEPLFRRISHQSEDGLK